MSTAICLKVSKAQGEKIITVVNKLEIIDKSLGIQRKDNTLCIPLLRQPQENEWKMLKDQASDVQLSTEDFSKKRETAKTFTQILQGQIPADMLENLPHAIDVIGDIAIIEVPSELKLYEKQIGAAILQANKKVKTVLAKAGAISGTYRLREFNFITGENKTETVHKEFGCQYHLDVAKAYFSPRLSFEHQRVASLVQVGETVVDLFAGVGPFSVLIAKKNPKTTVYAVDINPQAIEFLTFNIKVNRVEGVVHPVLGDARQIVAEKLGGIADRVIMNLPETALDYVAIACQSLKPLGGIIHFYAFIREPDSIENLKKRFSDAVKGAGRKVDSYLQAKSIRETAPYESQVVLDAKIS